MALFREFRGPYGFSYYDSLRTAVTVDKTMALVVYMCVLLYVAAIFGTLGSRKKSRFRSFLALTFNFLVVTIILVCICGHGWNEGFIDTQTTYIDYSEEKINAKIGISFSLISVNLTLEGVVGQNSTVYYNERLYLFDADDLQRQYHHKFQLGLPSPILTLCNYMSYEGSNLMWGRYFRTSGYYAYILLCSSFTFWIITIILMCSVVFYGSLMFLISGLTMCITVIVYHLLQPPIPLQIPFNGEVLEVSYGWCFYLVLITGVIISLIGSSFLALNAFDPQKLLLLFELEEEEELIEEKNSTNGYEKNAITVNGNGNHKPIDKQKNEPNLDMLPDLQDKNATPNPPNSMKNENSLQEISLEETGTNGDIKIASNGDLYHVVEVYENEHL